MAKNPTLAFGPKTANQNKNIRINRLSRRNRRVFTGALCQPKRRCQTARVQVRGR